MIRKLMLLLLMASTVITPAFASTENSVDRVLSVKEDYAFEPGKSFATLRIEEKYPNEFGNDPVSFLLKIDKAEWFELNDPAGSDPEAMEDDASTTGDATLNVERLGDRLLEITLNRGTVPDSEEVSWRIPIYAKVTDPGIISVEVDGMDGLVSSGTYDIARVLGDDYLYAGYRFTPDNPQWMTIREPAANAFPGTQTFRLVLENGTWFSNSDTRLGPQAMLKAAAVSGIEAGQITEIRRIDDKTLAVTLVRGTDSSLKAQGVWSIPLYFTVDRFGLAKITIDGQGSPVKAGTLGDVKVVEPIRYITTVTLTLNRPEILMEQGMNKRTVTLDVSPVNLSGFTMIPLRGVFEQMGGAVLWNSQERTVTLTSGDRQILLHADSAAAQVNGKAVTLLQKPLIVNGRLLIPLRSVSEQLGFGVEWLEAAQQIIIRQD